MKPSGLAAMESFEWKCLDDDDDDDVGVVARQFWQQHIKAAAAATSLKVFMMLHLRATYHTRNTDAAWSLSCWNVYISQSQSSFHITFTLHLNSIMNESTLRQNSLSLSTPKTPFDSTLLICSPPPIITWRTARLSSLYNMLLEVLCSFLGKAIWVSCLLFVGNSGCAWWTHGNDNDDVDHDDNEVNYCKDNRHCHNCHYHRYNHQYHSATNRATMNSSKNARENGSTKHARTLPA